MPTAPETDQLVRVRERRYVVTDVPRSKLAAEPLAPNLEPQHLVTLASVEDDGHIAMAVLVSGATLPSTAARHLERLISEGFFRIVPPQARSTSYDRADPCH